MAATLESSIIEQGAAYFFTQGVLGIVVLLLIGVVIVLYRKLDKTQEARLQDAKDFKESLAAPLKEQQETVKSIYEMVLRNDRRGN